MKIEEFYSKIRNAVEEFGLTDSYRFFTSGHFLNYLSKLASDGSRENTLKMTCMTVLFEGFYRSLADCPLKKQLTQIRLQRWANHFGTPTLTFLLTYNSEIEQTKYIFGLASPTLNSASAPWEIVKQPNLSNDQSNDVMVNERSSDAVMMPLEDEKTGQFLKTHNPSGGFTTTPCDPVSQKFIEYASILASQCGTVLEIGAAFGAASLQALAKGENIFCNDIDPNNLAVV